MPIERDIYQMYLDGPFDWLNPIDMFTNFLTDGPRRSWSALSHDEKLREIQRQYPNLSIPHIQEILDPYLSK